MFSLLGRCILVLALLAAPLARASGLPATGDNGVIAASGEVREEKGYWSRLGEDFRTIPLEFWSGFGFITFIGIKNWNWGSSSFHFQDEGWFGLDTGSGGTDKLGHAFTAYGFTNTFADSLMLKGVERRRAANSAAFMSQALMMYVEVFDGYSGDHGFSREDVVMNLSGTGLAWLRQTRPRFGALLDYRMEYLPSGYKGFNAISDYAGMKYLFAFKLAGLEKMRDTPLRYVELQAGYYTRGFTRAEQDDGLQRTRHDFIGIGINMNELLFGRRATPESSWRRVGRYLLEHYQIPYTAATHSRRL